VSNCDSVVGTEVNCINIDSGTVNSELPSSVDCETLTVLGSRSEDCKHDVDTADINTSTSPVSDTLNHASLAELSDTSYGECVKNTEIGMVL